MVKFNLKLQAYIVYNKSKSVRFNQTGLREGFLVFKLQIERISEVTRLYYAGYDQALRDVCIHRTSSKM